MISLARRNPCRSASLAGGIPAHQKLGSPSTQLDEDGGSRDDPDDPGRYRDQAPRHHCTDHTPSRKCYSVCRPMICRRSWQPPPSWGPPRFSPAICPPGGWRTWIPCGPCGTSEAFRVCQWRCRNIVGVRRDFWHERGWRVANPPQINNLPHKVSGRPWR
jgi:hypothetical protein